MYAMDGYLMNLCLESHDFFPILPYLREALVLRNGESIPASIMQEWQFLNLVCKKKKTCNEIVRSE